MDLIMDVFTNEVWNNFTNLILELELTNEIQWELEDKVRSEKTGEAAYAARVNNSSRVEIKNKINELLGFPCEVKDYK
jgi:hypothetical protein